MMCWTTFSKKPEITLVSPCRQVSLSWWFPSVRGDRPRHNFTCSPLSCHVFTFHILYLFCPPLLLFFLVPCSILRFHPNLVPKPCLIFLTQWDATPNAGFTTGTPWMRAHEDDAREGWNATDESQPRLANSNAIESESVLAFWKRAISVRKAHDVLVRLFILYHYQPSRVELGPSTHIHTYTHTQVYGDFEMCLESDERVFAYVRKLGHVHAWVVLNFSADVVEVPFGTTEDGPGLGLPLGVETGRGGDPELVLCNYDAASGPPGMDSETGTLMLRGYEARVYISSSSFLTT